MVTGRYPHQNGVMGLTGPPSGRFDLHPGERHAARLFGDAGYESVLCGYEHESPDCRSLGFEGFLNGPATGTNSDGDLRKHGVEIDEWLSGRGDHRPFYLQIGCHETHQKWTANDTDADTSNGTWMPPYLADHKDVRKEMGAFQGAVRRLDEGMGGIVGALEKNGVWSNTIFVFTTDHGIDLPRAKGTCFDPGLEIFLMMCYPNGGWGEGRRIDTLTSGINILPTLLEACEIPLPENLAGESVLGQLKGEAAAVNVHIYAEKTFHDTYDPIRCVRTDRYKYIRYFEVNIFEDLRLATMTRRHFWKTEWRRPNFEEAFYDLESDPLEMTDVVGDPAYAEVRAELKKDLLAWMEKTGDPLLDGPVASPYYGKALEDLKETD